MDKRNKAIGRRSLPFELREINEEKRSAPKNRGVS